MPAPAIHHFFSRESRKWNIEDFLSAYPTSRIPKQQRTTRVKTDWTQSLDLIIAGRGEPDTLRRRQKATYLRERFKTDREIIKEFFKEPPEGPGRLGVYVANSQNVVIGSGHIEITGGEGTGRKRGRGEDNHSSDVEDAYPSSSEGNPSPNGTQEGGDGVEEGDGRKKKKKLNIEDLRNYMKAEYKKMFPGRKWKLRSSGRTVEDVLHVNIMHLRPDSLLHQWILDPEDPDTKKLFTTAEWQEIMWLRVHNHITRTPLDPTCLLSDEVVSTHQLREILYNSKPKQGEAEEWVDAVYRLMLPLLEHSDKPLIQPHYEVWMENFIWCSFIGRLLMPLEGLVVLCKEMPSTATQRHTNRNRTQTGKGNYLVSCERLDGIFRGTGPPLEYGAYEVGKKFDGTIATKWIDDFRKLVINLSHMLRRLHQDVNVTRSNGRVIQVVGLMLSGLTCQSFRLCRKGNINILIRDELYTVPSHPQSLKDLSPLLCCLWQVKQTIRDCMDAVLSAGSNRK